MQEVPVAKEAEGEGPVPSVWRATFSAIVCALSERDYSLARGIPGVLPVADGTARQVQAYIADYGETLVALPDWTWDTSVCVWVDPHWDVLVDLYTEAGGPSDMVLHSTVREAANGFTYEVYLVYVP